MITKEELKISVNENLKFAKDFYEKGEQGFSTMLVAQATKDGKKKDTVGLLSGENVIEYRRKITFEMGLRSGLELLRGDIDSIDAVYLISEAWFSKQLKEIVGEKGFIKPSDDPNKQEAIISSGLSKEKISILEMFEIKKSFDLDTGKIKVNFVSMDEGGDKPSEAKSPLLECFWDGVEIMKDFEKRLPLVLLKHIKDSPIEKTFDMMLKQINNLTK